MTVRDPCTLAEAAGRPCEAPPWQPVRVFALTIEDAAFADGRSVVVTMTSPPRVSIGDKVRRDGNGG